jgi:hypothetical protein
MSTFYPPQCIHPERTEHMEKSEVRVLKMGSTLSLTDPNGWVEYVCYCPECNHIIALFCNPPGDILWEYTLPPKVEEELRGMYQYEIGQLEKYTSRW